MLFGKKKEAGIKAMHYEGINGFATDYPCRLEVKGDDFVITRIKTETVVTLPLNRINSFTAMEEQRFMQDYHSNAGTTSKFGKKYYLVGKYDKGMLVFWGTGTEYGEFVKLQNNSANAIEL